MGDVRRKGKRRLLRTFSTMVMAGATALAILEFLRLLFRNNQLFDPSREPAISWNPADYGLDPSRVDDFAFESDDGTVLHAWYVRARRPIASVLYCHGNSGNLTWSATYLPALVEAGLNLMIFDYRGFGRSMGYPTLAGVLQDAEAAAREHHAIRPHDLPSILYGYSLGGAISAQIAQSVYFDGMVLQSTFTNLADMARVRFPKLPIHLISGHDFDSMSVIRRLKIPTLVIHGDRDDVIPVWMGESLYKSCESARGIHIVNGAMHTDLYEKGAAGIVDAIRRFALSLRAGHAPHPISQVEPPTFLDRVFSAARHTSLFRRGQWLRPAVLPSDEPITG